MPGPNPYIIDTDSIIIRNGFFMLSNSYIPQSTNFVVTVGAAGAISYTNALANLSTYGIGYLPDVFSTFNGQLSNLSTTIYNGGVTYADFSTACESLSTNIVDLSNWTKPQLSTLSTSIGDLSNLFNATIYASSVTQGQLLSTTASLENTINVNSTLTGESISSSYALLLTNPAGYAISSSVETLSTYVYSTLTPYVDTINENLTATASTQGVKISSLYGEFYELSSFAVYLFLSTPIVELSTLSSGQNVLTANLSSLSSFTTSLASSVSTSYVLLSNLSSALSTTNGNVAGISSSLSNYATTANLSTLSTSIGDINAALSNAVTGNNISTLSTALSNYATLANLSTLSVSLENYATLANLSTLSTALSNYATLANLSTLSTSLENYATKANLSTLSVSLENYVTKANLSTLSVSLENYVTKANLSTLSTALSNYATLANLSTLSVSLENYATKANLSTLSTSLENYATKANLSTLSTALSNYVAFSNLSSINVSTITLTSLNATGPISVSYLPSTAVSIQGNISTTTDTVDITGGVTIRNQDAPTLTLRNDFPVASATGVEILMCNATSVGRFGQGGPVRGTYINVAAGDAITMNSNRHVGIYGAYNTSFGLFVNGSLYASTIIASTITASTITGYATLANLSTLSTSLENYATKNNLSTLSTALSNYATLANLSTLSTALSNYATLANLSTLSVSLENYATLANLSTLSTSLENYATKANLSTLSTSLENYATLANLSTLSTSLENYATKDNLSTLSTALSNYATLANLSTLSTALSNYATLANLSTLSTSLENYATKDNLSTLSTSLSNYVALSNLSSLNVSTILANSEIVRYQLGTSSFTASTIFVNGNTNQTGGNVSPQVDINGGIRTRVSTSQGILIESVNTLKPAELAFKTVNATVSAVGHEQSARGMFFWWGADYMNVSVDRNVAINNGAGNSAYKFYVNGNMFASSISTHQASVSSITAIRLTSYNSISTTYNECRYAYIQSTLTISTGMAIGTTSTAGYLLNANGGDINITNGVLRINNAQQVPVSDERIKENISSISLETCLSTLEAVPLRTYNFRADYAAYAGMTASPQVGVIAQEIADIFPGSIQKIPQYGIEDLHFINYNQLYLTAVGATKKLAERERIHTSTIQGLEQQIQAINGFLMSTMGVPSII